MYLQINLLQYIPGDPSSIHVGFMCRGTVSTGGVDHVHVIPIFAVVNNVKFKKSFIFKKHAVLTTALFEKTIMDW